jgi:predicted MFS family arabinose efflux permease
MRAGDASCGAALGGLITQALGWEWVFLINVPIGIAVLVAGPRLLPALRRDPSAQPGSLGAAGIPRRSRDPSAQPGFLGALTGTIGLLLLSTALVEAPGNCPPSMPSMPVMEAFTVVAQMAARTPRSGQR